MKVSVIIPTFNYGRFLTESICSVQDQGIEDIEIIVVDDGSTDETSAILASIDDCRLQVHQTNRAGVSGARNRGLDVATGDFIAFLDADDRWRPGKLHQQLALMTEHPDVDLVFTDFVRFDNTGCIFDRSLFSYIPELDRLPTMPALGGVARIIETDAFESLVPMRELASWVPTCLIRRSTLGEVRFPNGVSLCEDLYYVAQLYRKAKVAYLTDAYLEVRRHGSNSYNDPDEILAPKIQVLELLLSDSLSARHRHAVRQQLGLVWSSKGRRLFHEGRALASFSAYLHALNYPSRRLSALLHILASPLSFLRRHPRGHGSLSSNGRDQQD